MTRQIVRENDSVKGDERSVADGDTAGIGHVEIGAQRYFRFASDVHSGQLAQAPNAQFDQGLANGEHGLARQALTTGTDYDGLPGFVSLATARRLTPRAADFCCSMGAGVAL
jgi:hypothetical protein